MLAELQNAQPHTNAAGGSGTLWVRHSITYSDGVAALRNAHIAQPRTIYSAHHSECLQAALRAQSHSIGCRSEVYGYGSFRIDRSRCTAPLYLAPMYG